MYIEQIYNGCLNEAAYFIESNGEAVIIDPVRDINVYLELASKHNAQLKYIFETKIHFTFVSGHVELSRKTDAPIVFGPMSDVKFRSHIAKDGEIFKLGNITIEAIHTPGHTLESTCYLIRDEKNHPYCIFTGISTDDISTSAPGNSNLTEKEMAALLYHSIQNKLLPLPDDVIVYSSHSKEGGEKFTNLGIHKKENPLFQPGTLEEFIITHTRKIKEVPAYFNKISKLNKEGYTMMENILEDGLKSLSITEFKKKIKENFLVLDTRESASFTQGFIPGSISINLQGRFEETAGEILPYDQPILLITDVKKEVESVTRLARVGFENVQGYLKGGFDQWNKSGESIDLIIDIEADELAMDMPFDENLLVLDVRTQQEFVEGHVKESTNIPLRDLQDLAQIASLEEDQNIYIHSSTGYKSVTAASLLKRQGYHNLRNILGGWNKIIEEEKIPTEKSGEILN